MKNVGRPIGDTIEFNQVQEQVLYGTMLGDAFMKRPGVTTPGATSTLQFEHSTKQMGLALWKAEILGMKTFPRDRYDRRTQKTYHSVYAYSKASPTYTKIYRRVYGEGGTKNLDQNILNQLTPLGIAVWYMDDGALSANGRQLRLHTEKYTYRENILIKEYFQETWNLYPKIYKKRSKGGIKYYLCFTAQDTYSFIEIVKPYILPDLEYKIQFTPYVQPPQWYKDIISTNQEEVN